MATHFITDIEILDFKCFKDFKANGFKRVNLISGKNNVGKTAFMEACYIHVYSKEIRYMIGAIIGIKFMRENINLLIEKDSNFKQNFLDATKKYATKSNLGQSEFCVNEDNATKDYRFCINNVTTTINSNVINITKSSIDNIGFIDNFGWSDNELVNSFKSIQKQDKEIELNGLINSFDKDIISFKVIGNKPQCKIVTNNLFILEYRDIVEFGDGLKHYISIICALYACENGYLFIDEIDNGIHYSQLDNLWKLILSISKKTNCQVFATTHSKEMLESYARVAKKLDDSDVSYTTLVKNKSNEIKALTLDYEMLTNSIIDQEHEVR